MKILEKVAANMDKRLPKLGSDWLKFRGEGGFLLPQNGQKFRKKEHTFFITGFTVFFCTKKKKKQIPFFTHFILSLVGIKKYYTCTLFSTNGFQNE